MTKTLYVISRAAPPACHVTTGIRAAQARGWDVADDAVEGGGQYFTVR
ncbi:hypothetical protein AB0F18_20245 [Streptomyces sp. NPDC029216]